VLTTLVLCCLPARLLFCRYHGSSAAAKAALPYDAGFESVGVIVAAAPDAAAGTTVALAVAVPWHNGHA
jgi:hypothetical protein